MKGVHRTRAGGGGGGGGVLNVNLPSRLCDREPRSLCFCVLLYSYVVGVLTLYPSTITLLLLLRHKNLTLKEEQNGKTT